MASGAGASDIASEGAAQAIGRAVLDSDLVATIGLDRDWRVVEVSAAAEQMFGRRREEALGAGLGELIVSPRLEPGHSERTGIRHDGAHFPVELSLIEVDGRGETRFVCFLRDITTVRMSDLRVAAGQALLSEAEELAAAGSFEGDLRSGAVVWSEGILRLLGLPRSSPPTLREAFEMIEPEDRGLAYAALGRIVRRREPSFVEQVRIVRSDGIHRVVELRGKLMLDDFGEAARLVGTARDTTEEVASRHDRDLLSYVVESSDDAIVTQTIDGTITSWNHGAERLYGYNAEEAIGRPIGLIVPLSAEDEQAAMTRSVFAGEAVHAIETVRMRKDGADVPVSLSISPVRDDRGRIVSAAIIARDMTERRRYEARLRALAEHDHLTGLLNRRRFEMELRRELSRASRSGQGGAVLSVDLDGFKQINDSAGHAAGDEVLRAVANSLTSHLRESDTVARLGGDEFAVLLPSSSRTQAQAAAEHLLDTLHACQIDVDGTRFHVGASIGVALFSDASARWDELMVGADLAMYAAKQQGRDRVVVYTVEEAQAARADARLSWGQRIRQALDQDGFVVYWQPIVQVRSGRPAFGELLLRMRGADGRLVAPVEFLGAAERLGLIHAIDRWVVSRAIEMLAAGETPGGNGLSVNLSAQSVAGAYDLMGMIEGRLRETGADPEMLVFEITETAAIANIGEARRFASALRGLGCRLALDDFGTGFGSFYHLKHLPVDLLKIDREFVHHLPHSEVDQRLVESIVDVSRSLGIQTVAEWVTDEPTVTMLEQLGVDYIQGFHVGEPAPIDDAQRYAATGRPGAS